MALQFPRPAPWRNNNLTLPQKENPLSEQGETIIGIYLLSLGWMSWFGNSIVIFILYKQRLSLLPTDYLTFNLAVSDASISVFGYSRGIIEIFNVFRDDGFLITSIWTCQVDGFLTLLFGLASINTLTLISVTRYIKGCHPQRVNCISNSSITISLVLIWIAALFWSVAPLLGWGSYRDRMYGTCEIDWTKASYSTIYKSYIVSIFICCFFLPVIVMLFCYMSIINTVKTSRALACEGDPSDRHRKMERDVTRVSIVICTAFIIAWSPYAVISMWSACGYHVPGMTSILASLFAKSASFYNPLIYFGMSSKFRKDLRFLLPCTKTNKDPVKLKRFKHLKQKHNPTPPVIEEKYNDHPAEILPAHSQDSGMGSPTNTPPLEMKDVYTCENLNLASDSPNYECDRL
ncbi:visual pigment-like receptor peropsin [Bombina bombina]|uniref:visual pigment-like receptor peropsin n=1 Tax=Bombina bombina TaxID=8345 RepID=UPI00235A9DBB|nr:visual pigment-like receptor peropsin [Bombina bombina]